CNVVSPTVLDTLSLHDALPIFHRGGEIAESLAHPRQHRLAFGGELERAREPAKQRDAEVILEELHLAAHGACGHVQLARGDGEADRKSTRLNSSHSQISYAVFC